MLHIHCYTYIVILIFNKNNTTSKQLHYETHRSMDKDIDSTPFYHNKINYWNSFPYSIKSITELHLYKWNVMLCGWLSLICKINMFSCTRIIHFMWFVYLKLDSWHNIRNRENIWCFLFNFHLPCMYAFMCMYICFIFVGNSIWSEFWWNKHPRSTFLATVGGTISSSIDYECFAGV